MALILLGINAVDTTYFDFCQYCVILKNTYTIQYWRGDGVWFVSFYYLTLNLQNNMITTQNNSRFATASLIGVFVAVVLFGLLAGMTARSVAQSWAHALSNLNTEGLAFIPNQVSSVHKGRSWKIMSLDAVFDTNTTTASLPTPTTPVATADTDNRSYETVSTTSVDQRPVEQYVIESDTTSIPNYMLPVRSGRTWKISSL